MLFIFNFSLVNKYILFDMLTQFFSLQGSFSPIHYAMPKSKYSERIRKHEHCKEHNNNFAILPFSLRQRISKVITEVPNLSEAHMNAIFNQELCEKGNLIQVTPSNDDIRSLLNGFFIKIFWYVPFQ